LPLLQYSGYGQAPDHAGSTPRPTHPERLALFRPRFGTGIISNHRETPGVSGDFTEIHRARQSTFVAGAGSMRVQGITQMGKKSRSNREPRKPKQVKPSANASGSLADLVKSRAVPPLMGAK
jgi:hypothetical protein